MSSLSVLPLPVLGPRTKLRPRPRLVLLLLLLLLRLLLLLLLLVALSLTPSGLSPSTCWLRIMHTHVRPLQALLLHRDRTWSRSWFCIRSFAYNWPKRRCTIGDISTINLVFAVTL